MTDGLEPSTSVAARIRRLLDDLADVLSEAEQAEVARFLGAGENGLALDTLSWIFIDERKPISDAALRQFDAIADAMELGEERFMRALHNAYNLQSPKRHMAS